MTPIKIQIIAPVKIGIVACCKIKLDRPAPAQDLYQSTLFKRSREYAERFCDRWYILSAEHGLLLPNQVVHPYDRVLSKATRNEQLDWAMETHWDLVNHVPCHYMPHYEFVVLAAWPYTRALVGMRTVEPLTGLSIGKRVAWLNEQLRKESPGAAAAQVRQ